MQHKNFFMVPNRIFDLELKPRDFTVYCCLLRHSDSKDGSCFPSRRVIAKEFIRTHGEQDLSVAQIAEATGISPSLLYRLFREEGRTPVEYLKQVRIRKAKELLLQPKKIKIGSVAAACGFSDLAYFCKVFRETEGISPKTFREHFRI